jgi:beta-glucanase (GH16 family)
MRKFTGVLLLSVIISTCASFSDPIPGKDVLIWHDEFDKAQLDTTKWIYRSPGPRRDAINVKESIEVANGNLMIITRQSGDEYHTGMVATAGKFEHTFGYWEARMKFQNELGHWSAFWLQSPEMGSVGDYKKYGAEIDIIEYLVNKGDTVLNNIHWDGYGDEHKHEGHDSYFPGLSEGYHRIGLEWTPEEYIFYVNDVEMWRTDQAVSHRPEYIILSLEVGKWAGNIQQADLPDTLFVDYVRVYEHKPDRK